MICAAVRTPAGREPKIGGVVKFTFGGYVTDLRDAVKLTEAVRVMPILVFDGFVSTRIKTMDFSFYSRVSTRKKSTSPLRRDLYLRVRLTREPGIGPIK